ncbi:phage protease [Palleronia caenipelagi]|uniref:Mu-like prophage I protein n=1 Tax=Palleronia caenipelagi TaxID=2489174 RepID=A0A547PW15_9RHOB|nr:phage protease [Palleronia caenipelagi]TRD18339.1 hypothetical protein FEV53_11835 [Palleronia caenipelagi]
MGSDATLTRQTAAAIDVTDAPSEIELMPVGRFTLADSRGAFHLDPARAGQVLASSLAAKPGGVLPIDFGHGIAGRAEKRSDAAGWITGLRVAGNRVLAAVDWTPAGAEALRSRAYRFFSPDFYNTPDRSVVRIAGGGLTNDPAIPTLRQLASKEAETMDFRAKIAAALGLSGDADDAAVIAAAEHSVETVAATGRVLASLTEAAGLETMDDEAVRQLCTRLKAPGVEANLAEFVPMTAFEDVKRQLASLEAERAIDKADTLIAGGLESGKLTPAMEGWARQLATRNMADLEAYLDAATPVLPQGRAPVPDKAATSPDGLSEIERQLCSQMGLEPEAFIATRKTLTEEAR